MPTINEAPPKYVILAMKGNKAVAVKLGADGEMPPKEKRKEMMVCAHCFDADRGTGGIISSGGYCTNCDGKGNV